MIEQVIQLCVSCDDEREVSREEALHSFVEADITAEFDDIGTEVLDHRRHIRGRSRGDSALRLCGHLLADDSDREHQFRPN